MTFKAKQNERRVTGGLPRPPTTSSRPGVAAARRGRDAPGCSDADHSAPRSPGKVGEELPEARTNVEGGPSRARSTSCVDLGFDLVQIPHF